MYYVVFSVFGSTFCLWDLFMFLNVIVICLLSLLLSIPLCEYTTFIYSVNIDRHSSGFQYDTACGLVWQYILHMSFEEHMNAFLLDILAVKFAEL